MDTLLSIITLYNYDPTIFDNLVVPDELDKDLVMDNIMLELGELELLYNDPAMMKFAIGRWSQKELKKWQDLYATTVLDYNPIENYNRTDDFTDLEIRNLSKDNTHTRNLAGTSNETRDFAGSNLETRDLATGVVGVTDTTDTDVQSGSNTNTKEVSGFNAAALVTESKETETLGASNTKTVHTETDQTGTDTGTVSRATTDTGTVGETSTDTGTVTDEELDTGTVELKKTGNSKGNIGVTTTQQMIEQERGVVEFNIYDYITESFKRRFCIMVY